MGFVPLVEEYRGNVLENIHYGAISVVDENGKVVYAAGDPHHMTFLRSAAKPFQAIPVMKRRIDEVYGLTGKKRPCLPLPTGANASTLMPWNLF